MTETAFVNDREYCVMNNNRLRRVEQKGDKTLVVTIFNLAFSLVNLWRSVTVSSSLKNN
jgi:hypothetical protein